MDCAADLREITQPKKKVPVLRAGQTVKVHARIQEGNKERIQVFEGLVIGVRGDGVNKTFTVRKIASGVGVERIWPVFSPKIEKIEVVKQAKIRRAKLNFIRGLTKKQSRFKEKFSEVMMEGEEEEPVVEPIEEEADNEIVAPSGDDSGDEKKGGPGENEKKEPEDKEGETDEKEKEKKGE